MSLSSRIAARFRDLPIRGKLRTIFILTIGIALLVAGLGIITADSFLFYNYLRRDLATFINVIGDNSTGALAFDDAKSARETLAALHAKGHVEIACLYQHSGTLLAMYARPDYKGTCPPPQTDRIRFDHGALVASREIRLAERPLGTLVVQYDLNEIVERIEIYGGMVLVSLLLSCLVAIAFSSRLRELIAGPILELAGIARSVSHSNDYTIRAAKRSQDELGTLADALNQMMEGIQSRDNELQMALADQRDALDRLAQLNADLKHSNTELGRSNNDLERFAFMASHDLQEPLRMITLYSELLVGESFSNDEGRRSEFVKHIVGGSRRMRELLADLLAYNEIAGTAEQPVESVDLNAVLRKAQQTLSVGIDETQAEIIAEQLPTLYAHPSRMASLFENLIGNAIKYRGQRPPRIYVSLKEDNDQFIFAVSDNGIGIEKEYQEKIFLAFQRLHGKNIPGTGIGLAICQRVVERYSGRIWVESEFGAGSTFLFTLPKSMAQKVI